MAGRTTFIIAHRLAHHPPRRPHPGPRPRPHRRERRPRGPGRPRRPLRLLRRPAGAAAMRLCLVSQEYPPDTAHGGIGAQTYLKAHGMARLGHEVTVLSHSVGSRSGTSTTTAACAVVRIPSADAPAADRHRGRPLAQLQPGGRRRAGAAADRSPVRRDRLPRVGGRGLRPPAQPHRPERDARTHPPARTAGHVRRGARLAGQGQRLLSRRVDDGGRLHCAWPMPWSRPATARPTGWRGPTG